MQLVVDELWTWERVPTFVTKEFKGKFETTLSKTAVNVLSTQCSGLVRGTRRSAKRLKVEPKRPSTRNMCPELSYHFVRTNWSNDTSFDCILTLTALFKDKRRIVVPLKKTRHFNELSSKMTMKRGCRLSKRGITFAFERDVEQRREEDGRTIGIDVGIADVWSDSRGNRSSDFKDVHGHTLSSILKKIVKKESRKRSSEDIEVLKRKKKNHKKRKVDVTKKRSKRLLRAFRHRDNFVNWTLNRLDLDGVSTVKVEDLKNMKKGKRCDRFRSHWTYSKFFHKVDTLTEGLGVRVLRVDPRNTSRKCSLCGAVDVRSRRGKRFKCVSCGHAQDADTNAAINVERAVPKWNSGEERLVPRHAREMKS